MRRGLTVLGIVGTFILLSIGAALIWWHRCDLDTLSLGEWGDFLAGFVAALAFLWLVLGYAQQGEQLRLNTQAFNRLLAEERDRAQPLFTFEGGIARGGGWELRFKNLGGVVHDLTANCDQGRAVEITPREILETNGTVILSTEGANYRPALFTVHFTDRLRERRQVVRLSKAEGDIRQLPQEV